MSENRAAGKHLIFFSVKIVVNWTVTNSHSLFAIQFIHKQIDSKKIKIDDHKKYSHAFAKKNPLKFTHRILSSKIALFIVSTEWIIDRNAVDQCSYFTETNKIIS